MSKDFATNQRVQALSRLAAGLLALAFVLLIAFDVIDAEKLTTAVFAVLAIGTEVMGWWYNNNMTKNAQESQKYKRHLDSMGSE
jgi:hypothetical protein